MIKIVEVEKKSQLRTFVDFPNKMYREVPQFVPAFYSDDLLDWNKKKNPAFAYCEARAFLAYKDGKPVGRIGAILNHRANEKWHTKRMRFSQVDFIDDPEVSSALFKTVEDWAREKGCNEVHGPLGFCDLDREGMLVEGFDRRNMFITYYNHPYYNTHLKNLGYVKDVDWVEMKVLVPEQDSPEQKKIQRLSDYVLKRGNFHIVDIKHHRDYKPYISKAFELVNAAYSKLYGVVELSKAQIDKYADKFLPLVNPNYCCLIEDDQNNLLAFGVGAPSMAEAMKKSRGHLFPIGWIRVLRSLRKNTALDLLLIAVRPDLQSLGLNAVIINHVMNNCIKKGIKYAETGPQLELNTPIQAQFLKFNCEFHKRRRCYVKSI